VSSHHALLHQIGGRLFIEDRGSANGTYVRGQRIAPGQKIAEVPDRDNPGTDKILLNHVTFKALPGDLIALMGPSGAGKTTLLTVLNGYLPPTSGEVRVNGENLYAIYDALRGSIGYVPQDDIVHPELTVKEAITYSAKFRLPSDYSDEEIERASSRPSRTSASTT
jgi:ABC-type multidrug transport system ATPase subunit